MSSVHLGVDIGGSGIKAALVDVSDGSLVSERNRVDTPQPATPESVTEIYAEMVAGFDYSGPVGVGFPSVIRNGIVETANNIDQAWIGQKVADMFAGATGLETVVINDADAAGLAETRFGVAEGAKGLVLMITFGTGIGSGMFIDGRLVPNLELGQLELEGHKPAELYFSAKARRRDDLDWDQWGSRANRFLSHVNEVFNPDLMVVGGGLAKHWEFFVHTLDESLPLMPAEMGNDAGVVGAALVATA
ncbi:MAG TPA: ROK family protein [Acidimicrobiia bacterium]|nr:ROK family protein [Acidimicrobiia bacterium]